MDEIKWKPAEHETMKAEQSMEELRIKLFEFGNPVVLKEGFVFTVLITGQNLSKWKYVCEIQKHIIEYAGGKYPLIEVLVNDDSFICMVLKPKTITN